MSSSNQLEKPQRGQGGYHFVFRHAKLARKPESDKEASEGSIKHRLAETTTSRSRPNAIAMVHNSLVLANWLLLKLTRSKCPQVTSHKDLKSSLWYITSLCECWSRRDLHISRLICSPCILKDMEDTYFALSFYPGHGLGVPRLTTSEE